MLQAVDDTNDSNDDGLNQSFMAHSAIATITTTTATALPSNSAELLLLHNDKFVARIAHMLNISKENLTQLMLREATNSTTSGVESTDAGEESLAILIALTICYALIFVAGVLGNLITCIVISRNNFMHTATNFYLFNLAISDIILLLSGIPQELYNLWFPDSYPFTDVMCIMGSVLSEMAANTTVLTITAFTVERYIAICHPFRQHTMSKLSRAIKFIFAIWLAAFLLALPQAMQFSVVYQGDGYSCTMEDNFYAHVFAVSGFIFFGGPMTAICVLYVLIGVKLKRSRLLQSLPRRAYDVNRGLNAQSRVIRMLVAVAVSFFLCWAPFHAQRLMAVYGLSLINIGINRDAFNDYFRILDYTSGVLYYLSTCINPLLYNIMSHKFREAFKITLTRQFGLAGKHQQSPHQHNYSALLRQNGSMRLQASSVNNNALEPYGSYRVVHFRCHDASHHQFSLQDSIRTTTTTIHSNNAGSAIGNCPGGVGARRTSGTRGRCSSLHKHELYGAATAAPHRMLQAQISQLSSVGDANSLLESQGDLGNYSTGTPNSYRAKRALLATHNGALLISASTPTQASQSLDAVDATATPTPVPGKRLKLSRVISRRDEHGHNDRQVVLEHQQNQRQQCEGSTASKALKFPWRKTRQKPTQPATTKNGNSNAKLPVNGMGEVGVGGRLDCGIPKSL